MNRRSWLRAALAWLGVGTAATVQAAPKTTADVLAALRANAPVPECLGGCAGNGMTADDGIIDVEVEAPLEIDYTITFVPHKYGFRAEVMKIATDVQIEMQSVKNLDGVLERVEVRCFSRTDASGKHVVFKLDDIGRNMPYGPGAKAHQEWLKNS